MLISLTLLRVTELHTNARAQRAKGSFTEGFRYVWSRPDLRAILVMLFLIGTLGLNFPIFISTMAVRVFRTDAGGYGLLSSIMAVGTIGGAVLAAGRDKPRATIEKRLGLVTPTEITKLLATVSRTYRQIYRQNIPLGDDRRR